MKIMAIVDRHGLPPRPRDEDDEDAKENFSTQSITVTELPTKKACNGLLQQNLPTADITQQSIAPIGACTAEFSPIVGGL